MHEELNDQSVVARSWLNEATVVHHVALATWRRAAGNPDIREIRDQGDHWWALTDGRPSLTLAKQEDVARAGAVAQLVQEAVADYVELLGLPDALPGQLADEVLRRLMPAQSVR